VLLPICSIKSDSPQGIGCLWNTSSQITLSLLSHHISIRNTGWTFFSFSLYPMLICSLSREGGDYNDIKRWLNVKKLMKTDHILVPVHVNMKYVATMSCLLPPILSSTLHSHWILAIISVPPLPVCDENPVYVYDFWCSNCCIRPSTVSWLFSIHCKMAKSPKLLSTTFLDGYAPCFLRSLLSQCPSDLARDR